MLSYIRMEPLVITPGVETANPNRLAPPEIRAALDRILRSRAFVHSHRIRRFLQFIVEECLNGQQQRLKEYLIGLEVFNRLDTFDPRVDSIVRVEARRLRSKLEEYYENEGRHDEVRIELRKGSYVPIIDRFNPAFGNGYRPYPAPVRRHSLAIGRINVADEPGQSLQSAVERLSHTLVKQGFFQVIASRDGDGGGTQSNGHAHAAPKPEFILEADHSDGNGRVRLQLLSVADQSYVWSDSGDLASLERLANSVNRAVVPNWGNGKSGRTKTHAADRQAFDRYLQGRYYCKLGLPETIRNSVAFFQNAVTRDPDYAVAWAALAQASLVSCIFGYSDPGEAKPKDAAVKAIEADAHVPEAHLALACARSLCDFDWEGGEDAFQQAIQLDACDSTAHLAYALQLACRGLSRPALLEIERALEIDPASLGANFVLGWLYTVARRYDDAIAQHRLISEFAPEHPLACLGLGWAYLGHGQFADALAQFTNAANLLRAPGFMAGSIGYCNARLGRRDEALSQLANLPVEARGNSAQVSAAAIYAGLGQTDEAFAALEQAAAKRDCSLPLQLLNPEFDSLRADQRFQALRERIGLRPAHNQAATN